MPRQHETETIKDFDFTRKYSYSELNEHLRDKSWKLIDWAKMITRLYPEVRKQSKKSHSFFAEKINDFRQYRLEWERYAKVGVTGVMVISLIVPQIHLATHTIIASAALSLFVLDLFYRFCPWTNLDPMISFSNKQVEFEDNEEDWQKYRDQWQLKEDSQELSDSNKMQKELTRSISIGTVLLFAAGIALTSHVASMLLVASLVAYAGSLLLQVDNREEVKELDFEQELPTLKLAAS